MKVPLNNDRDEPADRQSGRCYRARSRSAADTKPSVLWAPQQPVEARAGQRASAARVSRAAPFSQELRATDRSNDKEPT